MRKSGQIIVNNEGGLTGTQLGKIKSDRRGSFALNADGYLTATSGTVILLW